MDIPEDSLCTKRDNKEHYFVRTIECFTNHGDPRKVPCNCPLVCTYCFRETVPDKYGKPAD